MTQQNNGPSEPGGPGVRAGADRFLIRTFPETGPKARNAYRELNLAATGTKEQLKALGDPQILPRPWDPATCSDPRLRAEVWAWLEQVVTWINSEYVWDVDASIPSCWPEHPHLVHEIAILADQRRRAGTTLTSDALEEWHRYSLPAFVDRMRTRLKNHCEEGHQPWPARSRYARHISDEGDPCDRHRAYSHDVQAAIDADEEGPERSNIPAHPRLTVVDLDTGKLGEPRD